MNLDKKQIAIATAAVLTGVALANSAMAQSPTPQVIERVEVTGSAIKRIDAETAVPVTVLRMDDLRNEGVTTVEQVMSLLSSVQMQTGASQIVGSGSGGAAFANLRGIGANKTLVLLNGRRVANNALSAVSPDLGMIPIAAISRVEVLRDGASALYGTDAIGGVINFITRHDYAGGTVSAGFDSPQHKGGQSTSANLGFGFGELGKDKFNVFGFIDHQSQDRIRGDQRPFNSRYPGGISPTPFPANYFQAGDSGNPAAPDCKSDAGVVLVSDGGKGCNIATSRFVNYIPKTERASAMVKATVAITPDTRVGLEFFASQSKVESIVAPVPYGGLIQNRTLPDGSLNPYYPGNPGSSITTPNIPLDPNFAYAGTRQGVRPGFVFVKWRDLPNGSREDRSKNDQHRLILSLDGVVANWDYQTALTFNENKYRQNLAGYSDGAKITAGVLNGIINPFGAQSAAGAAYIDAAALNGNLQNAKGTVTGFDAKASREFGDWFSATRSAALAVGAEYRREKYRQAGNTEFAEAVVASTGFDPETLNAGSRNVYAAYAELNVPLTKRLDVTAAMRYDNYSDVGSTVNPKFSFRYEHSKQVLVRGAVSTGFRAPDLYELNAANAFTNTSSFNDPVNCPGGVPIAGKPRATNCQQQFQALTGGNINLKPEKSKNATLGFVFEPFKEANIGIDFWWVNMSNQIGALPAATVFGDPTRFANVFRRNAAGDLSTDGSACPNPVTCGYVDLRQQNLGDLKSNGIDFSGSYRLPVGASALTFRLQSSYMIKSDYQDYAGGPFNVNVGAFVGAGPIFRWQHNANLNWTRGAVDLGLAVHNKSSYLDQPNTRGTGHRVGAYTTFDLYGSWRPFKTLTLAAGVRNLLDRDPPLSYQTTVFQAGYDPRYTDPTGRSFYIRASYTFR
jgi:iron complex outermembrane recepter protein